MRELTQAGHANPPDDWLEWAAYRLANGEDRQVVTDQLTSWGLSSERTGALLDGLTRNPLFRATVLVAKEKKKLSDLNDLLLDLDSRAESRSKVPIETNIEPIAFFERYYTRNRPVILKGIAERWPAFEKWTLDYLRGEFGSTIVKYQCRDVSANHLQAFYENGQKGTLSSYLDLIESDGPESRKYYLMSQDKLLRRVAFRRLLKDVNCSIGGIFSEATKSDYIHLWLGPKGSVTPLHRDQNNIYLAQILGRKRVRLLSSLALDRVYNKQGHHSLINLDAFDFEKFDRAKDLRFLDAVIEPGDLLFIPVAWWHHVTSLDISISISGTNFIYDNDFSQLADYFA
jgi:ribosomal protein L16 Arg81 hydroxylase